MDLFVIGLSHWTAPVELRERLALVPAELEARLKALVTLPGINEAALISTCNRVEIYAASSDGLMALDALRESLHGQLAAVVGAGGADGDLDLDRHLYQRAGKD